MIPAKNCRLCPRLVKHRREVKNRYPDYHCRPVLALGDASSKLLIVGLAPGLHGANATGIPFTGDASGKLLFQCLIKFGFADTSSSDLAPQLLNCRITNAVKCLPPQNKPIAAEINACNKFLARELDEITTGGVILTLGKVAHDAVLKCKGISPGKCKFGHNQIHNLAGDLTLVNSYHCSRYNIQTRRLSVEQFESVFANIAKIIQL